MKINGDAEQNGSKEQCGSNSEATTSAAVNSMISSNYLHHHNNLMEPKTYSQAAKDSKWIYAMNKELKALEEKKTWTLNLLPPDKKAIGCFTQQEDNDYTETFAPVAKMVIVRTLLVIVIHHNWHIAQLDINDAFLHGDLHEEVYMSEPPGYTHTSTLSQPDCKLQKSLYGLKQANIQWFTKLTTFLLNQGFTQSYADTSLLTYRKGEDFLALLIYVDDILLIVDPIVKLNDTDGEPLHNSSLYRAIVGKLLYLTITRPALSYAAYALRQGLFIPSQNNLKLQAYCDSDWANCSATRRSITGFSIFLGSSLISWQSKKRCVVSRSSTEAEIEPLLIVLGGNGDAEQNGSKEQNGPNSEATTSAAVNSVISNYLHHHKSLMECSILVNGSPTDEFHFRRGLKQGDPLSPFLFILVMESLHLSFQNVVDEGLFKGVSVGSSLQLSHLFYADDVIFMGQWSESNIITIVHALDCFHKASGLRMNLQKSKLLGIAVEDEKVSRAAMKMGCCTLKTPFSYLGIKVGGMMTRIKSWDEIVAKLHSRLSKWKLKTLSIGGRLTLLKSVLGSTPIYYMSMFKVPSQVLKCLEDIRRQFFNGADPKEKKMSWVKWSRVLASKDKGGLGVSSFFALNRALLLKWVWRFRYDRNSLWTRFIKALYGNSGSIETPSKVAYSSTWLNIVTEFSMLKNQGMDLLSFMKKKVGDGQDTFFWEEVWMGDMTFKSRFPRVYALESDKKITVADKMNHNVLGFSLRRAPRDGVEMEQFRDMIAILEGVELPAMHDRWIWSLVGSGEFSVASARKFIDDHRLTGSPHKTRWVKVVPIKINVMAWKVRFDFLPTRLNLSRRGLELQSILCPNCNKEVESTSHIFFACSMVRDLYRKIASWWELSYSEFDSYDDWLDWFQVLRLHSKHRDMLEGACGLYTKFSELLKLIERDQMLDCNEVLPRPMRPRVLSIEEVPPGRTQVAESRSNAEHRLRPAPIQIPCLPALLPLPPIDIRREGSAKEERRKRISDKRTKNKAKNDKNRAWNGKRGKAKVKSKSTRKSQRSNPKP
ncbi:RNA-directed DNA polymerase, eukaryota, reverse transcriptase zinc-binding domain protein [Tanacetum coccineum]